MTVGFREVDEKRASWAQLSDKTRRKAMGEQLFPVVKGPDKAFYLLDSHHTALALVHEKADSVQAGLVKDLSHLDCRRRARCRRLRQGRGTILEFLWANYFRGRGSARLLKSDPKAARHKGLALAPAKAPSHLPGWCGKR